ncbi:TPA: hypothetical protein PL520_001962 [Clostridium perfringens]|nr:hypothetical protein [Clostridium perfringens]
MNYKHVDCKNKELKICLEYIANFNVYWLNGMNYTLLANMIENNLDNNIIKEYIKSTMKGVAYEALLGEEQLNSQKECEANILLDKLKKAYLEKNIDLKEKVSCDVLKFIFSKWNFDQKEENSYYTKNNLHNVINDAIENFVEGSFSSNLICSLENYSNIISEEVIDDYPYEDYMYEDSYLTEDDFNPYTDYGFEIKDDNKQNNNKKHGIKPIEEEYFSKSLYVAILDNRYELNNLLDYSCLIKENKKRLNENKIIQYVEMPDFGDDK